MSLIDRAKNILLSPKTEWTTIAGETATLPSVLTSYVLVLGSIPAISSLIASYLYAKTISNTAIITAVIAYVTSILSYVITSYVVDMLAGSFNSEKNLGKSSQLVAYSATGQWIASILTIIPVIGLLGTLAGAVYSIYLMYLGVGPVKKTPADKAVVYVVVVIVIMVIVSMVLGSVLGMILLAGSMMN